MADKWSVARDLDEISRYLELSEPTPFRARAFERAARAVENLDRDLAELVRSGELYGIPGIGKAIGPIIIELLDTGTTPYLDDLRRRYPPGIFDLLRVPGLGLKKIGLLHSTFGIGSLDDLERAAREGRLARLRGFGPKTQAKIVDGIEKARRRESKFLLPTGLEVGEWMRERLAGIAGVEDVEIAGSVRRRLEVIRNVNLAIATGAPAEVIRHLGGHLDRLQELGAGVWKGVARNEIDVVLHLTERRHFGVTVLRATGTSEFVAAFEKKAGRITTARTEEELFEKAAIAFVEPERRESADELLRKKRPSLVHATDLRGTFHVHTTFSDGRNTVREMLQASRGRGFEYVGISDHSKAAYYAGGLTEERLREQQAEIDRQAEGVAPMRVFKGSEADILPDGTIDYDVRTRSAFDFIVASVHSRFGMDEEEMTARILRALDDPQVTFLGHLTGRLLLSRDGYRIDLDRIFERAAERGVIIEINGNPRRLELDWRHIGRAVERGVLFSIHPDAHSIAELSHVISGTWVARKGGLTARQIFNTRSVEEVEEHFARRKGD
ncbi:MAG TPA: helix-hairpin-helix domain-containing protein [Thermoanaerobaculia bacterium]|nr:helix-hairpin-helix domain-containing protein [Thermoanaerobaculia bacterium]